MTSTHLERSITLQGIKRPEVTEFKNVGNKTKTFLLFRLEDKEESLCFMDCGCRQSICQGGPNVSNSQPWEISGSMYTGIQRSTHSDEGGPITISLSVFQYPTYLKY